jgi:hypothetical protein
MPRLARIATPDHGIFTHEPVRNGDLAAHRSVSFRCPRVHTFTVTFASDAKLPASWECRRHSVEAGRIGVLRQPTLVTPRTHLDMVRERRPERELARLLAEQLRELRAGRLLTVDQWLRQRQQHRTAKESR